MRKKNSFKHKCVDRRVTYSNMFALQWCWWMEGLMSSRSIVEDTQELLFWGKEDIYGNKHNQEVCSVSWPTHTHVFCLHSRVWPIYVVRRVASEVWKRGTMIKTHRSYQKTGAVSPGTTGRVTGPHPEGWPWSQWTFRLVRYMCAYLSRWMRST